MTLIQIVEALLYENNILHTQKLHSRTSITYYSLFKTLLETNNLAEAAPLLGIKPDTLKHLMSKNIRPIFKDKTSKILWRNYFLSKYNKKRCSLCEDIINIEDFGSNTSYCKECMLTYVSMYKKEHPEIDKQYYLQHKSEFIFRKAKRRAQKLHATVPWANLDKIASIYKLCPKDYHVDHIIPLQGETVCGLHVENNLQYLTAFDNKSKGNKLLEIYV